MRDLAGRRYEGARPDSQTRPNAGGDLAFGAFWQIHAELVRGTSLHRGPGNHVLPDGGSEKAPGGNDLYLAGCDVVSGDEAARAAKVVGVGVGVDDGEDGEVPQLFIHQIHRRPRRFNRSQRVDDDPAGVPFDERRVREIEAAHLPDML